MYQQSASSNHWSFPPPPQVNGPGVPNHSPESLVADMWKNCPVLCASIRHNFDLHTIFHPALFAQHGETFLRLTASQIAMQNQASEMADMRNALSQRQRLLDVNAASAKDLQTRFMAQQSELKEIRGLLEQQPQSLTNPDPISDGDDRPLRARESSVVSPSVTLSPTTPTSTSRSIDGPTFQFYGRSTALPSLRASLPSDSVDKHDEKHGYGHAETQGPAFRYDLVNDGTPVDGMVLSSNQPVPVPPAISTSTIFEVAPSPVRPTVSLATKAHPVKVQGNEEDKDRTKSTEPKDQTPAVEDIRTSGRIKIMKREESAEPLFQDVGRGAETLGNELANVPHDKAPVTLLKSESNNCNIHQKRQTFLPNKPASYAAAVRTTPSTASEDDALAAKPPPTTSETSPTLDLGFTLEPLPKPTVRQVQSQQQQVQSQQQQVQFEPGQPQTPNADSKSEDVRFNFDEWKQRKIANGSWIERSNPRHTRYPHQRSFYPAYRGRGGRFQHHHDENFGPGPLNEEARKQEWLAWKQKLVSQGKWNPVHPFTEQWKND
jgi:hypothetical protein